MYTGTLWIGKREAGEGSGSGHVRVAEVGRLSWTVAESLRAFVERVIANFHDKNVVFYNRAETGNLGLLCKEEIIR